MKSNEGNLFSSGPGSCSCSLMMAPSGDLLSRRCAACNNGNCTRVPCPWFTCRRTRNWAPPQVHDEFSAILHSNSGQINMSLLLLSPGWTKLRNISLSRAGHLIIVRSFHLHTEFVLKCMFLLQNYHPPVCSSWAKWWSLLIPAPACDKQLNAHSVLELFLCYHIFIITKPSSNYIYCCCYR